MAQSDELGHKLIGDPTPLQETETNLNALVSRITQLAATDEEMAMDNEIQNLHRLLFNMRFQGVQQVEISIQIPPDSDYQDRPRPDDYSDEGMAQRDEMQMAAILRMQLASQGVPDTGGVMKATLRVPPPSDMSTPTLFVSERFGDSPQMPFMGIIPLSQEGDQTGAYPVPLKFIRGIKLQTNPTQPNSPDPQMPPRLMRY